jgi:uncharacterized protein YecE (DUF72 family)
MIDGVDRSIQELSPREETPDAFLFACKVSKFIIHQKRLGDTWQHLDRTHQDPTQNLLDA